ncbi:MAG: hypothetical protein JWM56_1262 [Candidatus Peribacteria bacterium]|nr:hypothetical protein [Candidatus Peribacteria bacterium]
MWTDMTEIMQKYIVIFGKASGRTTGFCMEKWLTNSGKRLRLCVLLREIPKWNGQAFRHRH